nr:MAG TPA: hypothetical protein [Caudoviricetes sp.]DAR89103.1 MAG TPA: hypothetical protein [Caudoviricetes sp.]
MSIYTRLVRLLFNFKKNWHNQKGFQERPPPILP